MKPLWVLFVCASLTLCAAAQSALTVEQAESACGSFHQNFRVTTSGVHQPFASPDADKAQVYLIEDFRNSNEGIGYGPTVRLGMDGRWIGADDHDSYSVLSVDPGAHHLCANWQSRLKSRSGLVSLANFSAQAGQTYYFRVRITEQAKSASERNSLTDTWYTLDLEGVNCDEGKLLLAQRFQGTSTVEK